MGAICHDLDNLLMAASGFLDLAAAHRGRDPERAWTLVQKAAGALGQVQSTVDRVHGFRRAVPTLKGVANAGAAALTAAEALRPTLPPEVRLDVEADPAAGAVGLKAEAIAGAIEELVRNAVEAARGPVHVRVRVAADVPGCGAGREVGPPAPHGPSVPPGPAPTGPPDPLGPPRAHVRVEVEDDGPGMAPEVRERIFEPFFTTSGDPRRGFGLAAIHGLVATCGGTIDVESAPGAGTTVRIRLPRA